MNQSKENKFKPSLIFYDLILFICVALVFYVFYFKGSSLSMPNVIEQLALMLLVLFLLRLFGKIYRRIWRYGGIQSYVRLLIADVLAFLIFVLLELVLPFGSFPFILSLTIFGLNTLVCVSMRLFYGFAYKYGNMNNAMGALLRWLIKIFSLGTMKLKVDQDPQKVNIVIIGAGSVGVGLLEDIRTNRQSQYVVTCFIDNDPHKVGHVVSDVDVLEEGSTTIEELKNRHVQEVVFAVPDLESSRKLQLYDYYQKAGFKVKVYDFPRIAVPGKKRQLREFDIEDLLMRQPKEIINDRTRDYYRNQVILITGGGGSIGSEICRQLVGMSPKQIIILDIYENCAYEVQQNIRILYGVALDVRIEIVNITNKAALERVFEEYHPDICIHAAAHKHVVLMEKNCVEAIENNVFGTLNVLQCCEAYGCGRFMMVSTDKAVNPTNVMGATKRICEMMTQAYSTRGKVICTSTRFGNVLGSAGSVIPLFKRQIASGGPVTITDKRIIRYFMTIPEASQLVLTSGAMAENGELFVLDMGEPVKIYDLAKNMIAMSGLKDIEIVEVGLRPGEKLYEELLVKKDVLQKTDNDLIYIEQETPCTMNELEQKLRILREACRQNSDAAAIEAIKKTVPTYRPMKH